MWQQAAAEGITVIVSTGDNGSAGCDVTEINGEPTGPAVFGLEVNGIASTPFNVAVGGTDFNDFSDASSFSNSTNVAGTQESAKSYIPETTWNDTCTNVVVYATVFSFSDAPRPAVIPSCGQQSIRREFHVARGRLWWQKQLHHLRRRRPIELYRRLSQAFLASRCNAEW